MLAYEGSIDETSDVDPNDLMRLAYLLELQAETMQLFSATVQGGNGKVSRMAELCATVTEIAAEIKRIASGLGATPMQ